MSKTPFHNDKKNNADPFAKSGLIVNVMHLDQEALVIKGETLLVGVAKAALYTQSKGYSC